MAKQPKEKHVCQGLISSGGGWGHSYHKCGKVASVEEDGKWYCKVHAPSLKKARRDKRDAGYKASWAAADAKSKKEMLERMVGAEVIRLADDPRTENVLGSKLASIVITLKSEHTLLVIHWIQDLL